MYEENVKLNVDNGIWRKTMYYTNENMLLEYKYHLMNEEKSAATIEKYIRDIKAFFGFLETHKNSASIEDAEKGCAVTKGTVISYKEHLKEKYTPRSMNSMIAAINGFFEFVGWQECKVKPLKITKNMFRTIAEELTKEEYLKIIAAAKSKNNERIALVIETLASTGIRVSELKYITVESIRYGKACVTNKGKSRLIFLPKRLCLKLKIHAKEKGIKSGAVFITKTGKQLDRSNIWHDLKKLCETAKVPPSKVFPHNLRHLFAVTYYRLEKDLGKLADILGHSNIETTRIYTMTTGIEHDRQINSLGLVV